MIKNFKEAVFYNYIDLPSMEEDRKIQMQKNKSKFIIWIVATVAICIIVSVIAIKKDAEVFVGFSFIIGFGLLVMKRNQMQGALKLKIKEKLLKNLVRSISPSITFDTYKVIDQKLYLRSELIKNSTTRIAKNFFKGEINNIRFDFFELKLWKTSYIRRKYQNDVIFDGPFFAVKFKRNFRGRTIVVPDKYESQLGEIGRAVQQLNTNRLKEKLMRIDNYEFEKHFAVYSNYESESRKLLQSNLCNLLIDEKNKSNGKVYFSCIGNKFYLGLYNYKEIFKINVNEEITENNLQKYYDEVVDYLNLVLLFYSTIEENMNN